MPTEFANPCPSGPVVVSMPLSSLYSGLPLRAGCVVTVKVTPELGDGLDLELHVVHVEQSSKSSSEVIHMKLASEIAILNETTKIE